MTRTVLILGGTGDARTLAARLYEQSGLRVISSLAGRTSQPVLPAGEVRIGGFGGADALAGYLNSQEVEVVIDATHPFAIGMGRAAFAACQQTDIPLLRLDRTPWRAQPGDRWDLVDDWDHAASLLASQSRRVLLAIGRQDIRPFAALADIWFLVRSVDIPSPLPVQSQVIRARGPFTLDDERALLGTHRIDTIVCKNSGGHGSSAKLTAARDLGIRVILRQPPQRPQTARVTAIDQAVAWAIRGPGPGR